MSSKIRTELEKAAALKPKSGEADGNFLARVVNAIGEVDEASWDGLSEDAKAWYNQAVDDLNAKKPAPAFPDEVSDEPKTTTRRGVTKPATATLAKGATVTVVNARDKEFTGEVIELDDEIIVVNVDGDEKEFVRAKLKSCVVAGAAAEPDEPSEPTVGVKVSLVNARDKTFEGKVIAIDDDEIVIEVDGEEKEFSRAKLKSCVVVGGAAKKPAAKTAAKVEKEEPAADGKTKRVTNAGVSVGQRIRELIVANLDATADEIMASLTKEGLEFRPPTVQMTYADSHKLVKLLREAKKLK
jgi:ribosome maturation factor RimP